VRRFACEARHNERKNKALVVDTQHRTSATKLLITQMSTEIITTESYLRMFYKLGVVMHFMTSPLALNTHDAECSVLRA
jgi:hypothetical protein